VDSNHLHSLTCKTHITRPAKNSTRNSSRARRAPTHWIGSMRTGDCWCQANSHPMLRGVASLSLDRVATGQLAILTLDRDAQSLVAAL
jgi:hypothetical protein